MKWGQRWSDPWGEPRGLRITPISTPGTFIALVEWSITPAASGVEYVFLVYVNGARYDATRDSKMVVVIPEAGRAYVEVFVVAEWNEDEDCLSLLDPIPGDRVQLTWTPGAGAVVFEVYWNGGGVGAPSTLLDTVSAATYTTGQLAEGTHKFRIDSKDAAGNKLTSATVTTVVIDRMPDPPSGLVVTEFDPGTEAFAATFTASPSTDVVEYRIYSNGGLGNVDYTAAVGTVAAPATGASWVEAGAGSGDWVHAIRAYDGTYEETNVDVRFAFELAGAPLEVLDLPPATPTGLIAIAIADAVVALACEYPMMAERAIGAEVHIYYDGGTGTVDYVTPLASVEIPAHEIGTGRVFLAAVDTGPLTDGVTYKFVARAVTAGGRESPSSVEVTATADSTPPADVTDVSAEAVI